MLPISLEQHGSPHLLPPLCRERFEVYQAPRVLSSKFGRVCRGSRVRVPRVVRGVVSFKSYISNTPNVSTLGPNIYQLVCNFWICGHGARAPTSATRTSVSLCPLSFRLPFFPFSRPLLFCVLDQICRKASFRPKNKQTRQCVRSLAPKVAAPIQTQITSCFLHKIFGPGTATFSVYDYVLRSMCGGKLLASTLKRWALFFSQFWRHSPPSKARSGGEPCMHTKH